MLTQGYKGSSISIASLQEVMSIQSFKSLLYTDQQRKPQLFFPSQFSIAVFQRFASPPSTHFYVCFTAGSMDLVSWRGFLFSPVLYNEGWVFVLGSSPLIMTRKKKCETIITVSFINSPLIRTSHPFTFPHSYFQIYPKSSLISHLFLYESQENSEFF